MANEDTKQDGIDDRAWRAYVAYQDSIAEQEYLRWVAAMEGCHHDPSRPIKKPGANRASTTPNETTTETQGDTLI